MNIIAVILHIALYKYIFLTYIHFLFVDLTNTIFRVYRIFVFFQQNIFTVLSLVL